MADGKRQAQSVELAGLSKRYGKVAAVDGVSLTIGAGEFLTLLGPSGSGKSTTLMLIAGFERPDGGEIRIGGRRMNHVPPYRRNLGVVFQHYALFPHKTVAENVAFPLEERGIGRADARRRTGEALARVRMDGYEERYPSQLSGGQQQRIALARALVFDPPVLLMDEPLSALDKKLREQMQLEIKHIQRDLGITVVYVTHDQGEALTMSDRIAVMNQGRIAQLGSPEQLYERPADRFVADFIGETNFLELVPAGAGAATMAGGIPVSLPAEGGFAPNQRMTVALRPERIALAAPASAAASSDGLQWHEGTVEEIVYIGEIRKYRIRLGGQVLTAKQQTGTGVPSFTDGARVAVGWHPADLRPVREETAT